MLDPQNPMSPISRLIAFFVAPIVAAVSAIIVNAAQDYAGIDLNAEQLGILLTAVVLGELAVVFKWLDNRGKYEQQALDQRPDLYDL